MEHDDRIVATRLKKDEEELEVSLGQSISTSTSGKRALRIISVYIEAAKMRKDP